MTIFLAIAAAFTVGWVWGRVRRDAKHIQAVRDLRADNRLLMRAMEHSNRKASPEAGPEVELLRTIHRLPTITPPHERRWWSR
ncbi:hypothetical protein ACQPZJ_01600 [Actinoplanes sp. CA-054009]